jgi:hypothetical protein
LVKLEILADNFAKGFNKKSRMLDFSGAAGDPTEERT